MQCKAPFNDNHVLEAGNASNTSISEQTIGIMHQKVEKLIRQAELFDFTCQIQNIQKAVVQTRQGVIMLSLHSMHHEGHTWCQPNPGSCQ